MLLTKQIMNRLAAEFLGSFGIVFAGTGAIVINDLSGGAIGHAGIALTFGLIVLAMIHAFGDVSGAHLNPAVTVAFAAAGRFPWRRAPGYLSAQVLGGVAASASLHLLFPAHRTLGATLPSGSAGQSFALEIILSALLMLVILSVSHGAKERGLTAAAAIAAVVALEAMFAGPISGASMNPARSLAPALVSGTWESLWVYLTAPVLGALLAIPLCRLTRGRACCSSRSATDSSILPPADPSRPCHP